MYPSYIVILGCGVGRRATAKLYQMTETQMHGPREVIVLKVFSDARKECWGGGEALFFIVVGET